MPAIKQYEMPLLRVEIAIQRMINNVLCTLFIKREEQPYKGKWALPGGLVRIDKDTSLEDAARRVAFERLNASLPYLIQFKTIGGADRDPRATHGWSVAVVYRALVNERSFFEPLQGKRVIALRWMNDVEIDQETPNIAFDHASVALKAIEKTRDEVAELKLPTGYLPDVFTLPELQRICEGMLGKKLDKSSFRRKLRDRGLVSSHDKKQSGVKNRPATYYSFTSEEDFKSPTDDDECL